MMKHLDGTDWFYSDEPPLTPQRELAIALRDHLYGEVASAPSGKLKWVMSAEWLRECLYLGRMESRTARLFRPEAISTILGIPVEVRDDAGVPQLVPRGEPS